MPDFHEMDHPAKPFFTLFVAVDVSSAQNPNPSSKPPTPRSFDDGSVGLGIVAAADSPAQNPNPSPKPPTSRSFDDGSVGLGIIAAMSGTGPARSGPIPIVSARPAAMWRRPIEELSEGYTTGGMPVRKMVYLGDGDGGDRRSVASFLTCCYLCRKDLNGLDIFMYRYSLMLFLMKSLSLSPSIEDQKLGIPKELSFSRWFEDEGIDCTVPVLEGSSEGSSGDSAANFENLEQQSPHTPISSVAVLKILFFIIVWYTFSTCLTVYNKTLLGDHLGKFPAPLLMNTVHFTMQALLAKAIVLFQSRGSETGIEMT